MAALRDRRLEPGIPRNHDKEEVELLAASAANTITDDLSGFVEVIRLTRSKRHRRNRHQAWSA